MHRSSSWSREGYFQDIASPSFKASPGLRVSVFEDDNEMPLMYDPPPEEAAKKERARIKFAENAVHIIPFVLLLCAAILWFFSNPDVDVGMSADSIAARIEGLTIEGDLDTDSDQTGFLPIVDLDSGDLDLPKQTKDDKASRKLNKFK